MPSPCGLICTVASGHILPSASCYENIEDAVDGSSIIGTLSSNDRLRWKMRFDEIPLFVAQLSEFHLLPLHVPIGRRGLNSFEISSFRYEIGPTYGPNGYQSQPARVVPGMMYGQGYGYNYGYGHQMMYGPYYNNYSVGPGMMYGPYFNNYSFGSGMMYGPGYGYNYAHGPWMMYGPHFNYSWRDNI